ncbi:hypothetical protein HMPREF3224_01804 [Anaerococcus hydrogenalis]|nr:hypothetical protein HMPREF3224_01804 [Anaerococcus hydrogenalis]
MGLVFMYLIFEVFISYYFSNLPVFSFLKIEIKNPYSILKKIKGENYVLF